jgi:hypothetical protein
MHSPKAPTPGSTIRFARSSTAGSEVTSTSSPMCSMALAIEWRLPIP